MDEIALNRSRKYQLNESFFDEWSPAMAYVLGFWFADGYMRKEKSYRIVFTSADKRILEHIRETLSSSHPLRGRKGKASGIYTWDLIVCSKNLYERLENLGGFTRKSTTIEFPAVPAPYLADFIRGYFDGDGSVFFVTYNRTKDGRTARELRTNFTSGSQPFLEKLMQILHQEIGLSLKKLRVSQNEHTVKLGYGMKDSDTLLQYLYYANFPIGLQRKASFVYKVPKYQKHAKHARVA